MIVPLPKSQTCHPAHACAPLTLPHMFFLTKKVLQNPSLAPIYYHGISLKCFRYLFTTILFLAEIGSWFLLHQTREEPLRATVCFSIEHARARHAPRDASDVKFICQYFFLLEVFRYKRIKMYLTKSAEKRTIQLSLYFCYHCTKITPLF